jgi:ABC-type dipeptide/oligopeptide/nickel transport system permease subunit
LLIVLAIFAPWIAPQDPLAQNLLTATLPPIGFPDAEPGFWLGTDGLGRDVLSRVIFGARISLTVAFVAAGLACLIGSLLGLLAGFLRGWVDVVIARLVDIWMAFPPVLLSILLVAILGTGVHSVIAAIVVIDWTRFCRVVRTETMGQAQMDYVVAARTIGFSRLAILFREILPNVMPVLIALLTLEMGIAVVVEAILSFVGLSVSSDTPTWGGMIAEGRQIVHEAWWVLTVPLAALFATVVAFNQLGDGLARSLDPVLRR